MFNFQRDIICQRLRLWDNDLWQRQNMNINCCFNQNHIKLRYDFCKVKNCRLFTKSRFSKQGKVLHYIHRASLGTRKILTEQGISLNMKKPNQNFIVTNQISGAMHKEVYTNMNCTHKNMITDVTSPFAFSK